VLWVWIPGHRKGEGMRAIESAKRAEGVMASAERPATDKIPKSGSRKNLEESDEQS